jgi:thioesterase domain-containing protein/acyl carrier protein
VTRRFREPVGSERELAEIFAEVLGVDAVGLDDDVFTLGATSQSACALANAVNERFGTEITESTITAAPTVAQLAPRLTARRPRGSPVVVPVHATDRAGIAPPFFCVAGAAAPARALRALAIAIGDRPFYGIQARGLEELAFPDRSVPAMARRSLREMHQHQPGGPYLLGGHSFGGMVALEMARQLERDGERVEIVVIFDTIAPPWATSRDVLLRNLAAAGARPASESSTKGDAAVSRHVARASDTAARVAARGSVLARAGYRRAVRTVTLASAGVVPRRGQRQIDVFLTLSFRSGRAYRPTDPIAAALLVVRGHDDTYIRDPKRALSDLGWGAHTTGRVDVLDVPGNHLSIMRTPQIAAVAAGLREAFATVASPKRQGA